MEQTFSQIMGYGQFQTPAQYQPILETPVHVLL